MQAHYPMATAAAGGATTSQRRSGKLLDFSQVGPVDLLPLLEGYGSKHSHPPLHVMTHADAGTGNGWPMNAARARRSNPTGERHTTHAGTAHAGLSHNSRERSQDFRQLCGQEVKI